jgi:hypothetical protein
MRFLAYTSAVFSETRYAMNGDLHVAYRASAEGVRDIVFVCNPITSSEVFRTGTPARLSGGFCPTIVWSVRYGGTTALGMKSYFAT